TGRPMSMMTTSGFSRNAVASPSSPSTATSVVNPRLCSRRESMSRFISLSSTMRTFALATRALLATALGLRLQSRGFGHQLAAAEAVDGRGIALLVRDVGREAHGELRAVARLALHGDRAAHHLREAAREDEPQPRAAVLLRRRGVGLREGLEELR